MYGRIKYDQELLADVFYKASFRHGLVKSLVHVKQVSKDPHQAIV